jgi:broad specificity phosphatase PhoE
MVLPFAGITRSRFEGSATLPARAAWSPSQPGWPELPVVVIRGDSQPRVTMLSEPDASGGLGMASEIVLVRHGATEWSANGRHTGRTDLPLTDEGRAEVEHLCERLRPWSFALVLTSPLQRARETAELCGLGGRAEVADDLREWDYGDYEGLTTPEIRQTVPEWTVWTHACPNGETAEQVGARADRVLERVAPVEGAVAVFGHGHALRVLTARWLGLPSAEGRLFALRTGTICVLGHERDTQVIDQWNA